MLLVDPCAGGGAQVLPFLLELLARVALESDAAPKIVVTNLPRPSDSVQSRWVQALLRPISVAGVHF